MPPKKKNTTPTAADADADADVNVNEPTTENEAPAGAEEVEDDDAQDENANTVPKRKLSAANESEVDAKHSRLEEPVTQNEVVAAPVGEGGDEVAPDVASESVDAAEASTATPVAISQDADPSIGLMTITATIDSETGLTTEVWNISPDKVGAIIGTKGAIIQEIQVRANCKVLVDQNMPPGQNRVVTIIGTPEQVKGAGNIIKLILAHGPTAIHINTLTGGELLNTEMECAQPLVGRIIGGGGATIRELQARSGAKIQIDQDFPQGVPRKVQITGTAAAIKIASELIQYVLDNGPHLPPLAGDQAYAGAVGGMSGATAAALGSGGTMSFEVAKMHVGKIIGRGGEIITMIQQKSGCSKVQIDQNVPEGTPCKVMITGAPPNQQYAVHLIQEIMTGGAQRIHSLPFIGGGMGGMGGGGGASAYGPGGMQQQGIYGGGGGGGGGAASAYGGGQGGGYGAGQQAGFGGGYGQQQGGGYGGASGMYGGAAAGYGGQGQGQGQSQGGYGGSAAGYGAPPAATAKPASPWSEHRTDEGHTYWYNATSGVSTWERPADF